MSDPTDAEIEAERQAIVKKTIATMTEEGWSPIAHPTLRARLEADYPGFDYRPGEDSVEQQVGVEPAPIRDDAAEPAPMDQESLRVRLHEKEMERAETRSHLYEAQAARGIARTILAQCIATFVSGRPAITQQQLAEDFCAGALRDRQAAKDRGMESIPPAALHARSALDRNAAYATHGGADGLVQKRFVTGHRRGALSPAQAARANQERALAIAKAGVK